MEELYISLSGNDMADGTLTRPVRSLNEAKRRIEAAKDDLTVYIRGGRYFLHDSFVVDKTCGKQVVLTAYKDEKVYFDGGLVLDWKRAKPVSDPVIRERIIDKTALNHILEIDLSDYEIEYAAYGTRGFRRPYIPSGNELYINAQPYIRGQYPNKGEAPMPLRTIVDKESHPGAQEYNRYPATQFVYGEDRCDLWKAAGNFYMTGYFRACYADDTLEISRIDTKKRTMTLTYPHLQYSLHRCGETRGYAIDLLEEIDVPGEYYVDREGQKLYFYPKDRIKDSLIQLSVLASPLVALENVCNVTFEGIIFENGRGTGAYIERGENCIFRNCVFRNLGMLGIQIGKGAAPRSDEGRGNPADAAVKSEDQIQSASRIVGSWHEVLYDYPAWNNEGGKNHGIVNCEIYNTGTGGILLGGGDRKKLEPGGNYVHNCEIYQVNRLDKTYKAGVNLMGTGNRVSHCDIYNMSGFAVYLHGNDHIIEYNRIHDVIEEVSDAGAIYMGRDLSEVGNIIRCNFMYNIRGSRQGVHGVCAIYFDDGCSFNAVYQNYFYNINQKKKNPSFGTIFWNGGGQTSVNNNLFIDCECPLNAQYNGARGLHRLIITDKRQQMTTHTTDEQDYRGVDITSDVWREKYPYLYQLYEGTYQNEIMIWANVTLNQYYVPFTDAANLDFTFTEEPPKCHMMWCVDDPLMKIENKENVRLEIVDFGTIGRNRDA